ncbi:MAG: universal stress protein [Planctomycetes bacterium]|nr:universal stress protein [Planctomycetota bacterium]
MKKILVGVAGGERSDEAVVAALALANKLGAELELVHSVDVHAAHWPVVARARADAEIEAARRSAGEAVAAHLRSRRDGGAPLTLRGAPINDSLRVEVGSPAKVLLERAVALPANLIVLGSHRKRGIFDFGNTARAVLAKAAAPVWVQHGWARDVRTILAPVDLSDHSFAALASGRNLAKKLGAKVTTLYCFVHPGYVYSLDSGAPMAMAIERVEELRELARKEYEKRIEGFDWQGVAHEARFVDDDPIQGILAVQDGADLIVMGTHGVTGLSAAVLGSTAYGVLSSARTPVLVLPHPERRYQL